MLMFQKRFERLQKLADEIEKRRGDTGQASSREETPRRVDNAAFFSRIHRMADIGGAGDAPLV